MIRNFELNSREYELIILALRHSQLFTMNSMLDDDDKKMMLEEQSKLLKRLEQGNDVTGPGVYIDGVRA